MIRLTRLADYAVELMGQIAAQPDRLHNAADLGTATQIPGPTVSKILTAAARAGLLFSQRGHAGGFMLARPAAAITVADVIAAVDGPIALVECQDTELDSGCERESNCSMRLRWNKINGAIRGALAAVTLADIAPAPIDFINMPAREGQQPTGLDGHVRIN